MKVCTQCLEKLPFENFRRQSSTKDGYKYRCKKCDNLAAKEYYKNKKNKILKNVKKWQENNKEKVKDYKSKYYFKNKENELR